MIPRTKVNYFCNELVRASLVSENSTRWRNALTEALARRFGNSQILLTASGRGALYLLLRALPQTKVLAPAYTCKAVINAARLAGKEILYSECEKDGFNMDVESAALQMGPDVIVIATHQFGIPCAIKRILELAQRSGSFVLEDAAGALGTKIEGQLAGSFGDAAIFSFDSTKLVNVPLKAGFVLVRDKRLFEKCQYLQSIETHPMSFFDKWKYLLLGIIIACLENHFLYRIFHNLKFKWQGKFTDDSLKLDSKIGSFYRNQMTEWQAFLALPQIESLDAIIAFRQRVYGDFIRELADLKTIILPPADPSNSWACIRFPILVQGDKMEFYRQACKAGVDFAFSFTYIVSPSTFKRSHHIAAHVLDLPYYFHLTTQEKNKIVRILRLICK